MHIAGAIHPIILCPEAYAKNISSLTEAMLTSTCTRFNKDSKPFEGVDSVATIDIGALGSERCLTKDIYASCAISSYNYPADAKVSPSVILFSIVMIYVFRILLSKMFFFSYNINKCCLG